MFRSIPATILALSVLLLTNVTKAAEKPMLKDQRIRVLIITGGHEFEREPFLDMFRANPEISFRELKHPDAHLAFKPDTAEDYDVIVLYDMWPNISEEAKTDFMNLLKKGKGLVALHHCLGSYPDWNEYYRIIGGRYYPNRSIMNGEEKAASTYKHDVRFSVRVVDPKHPVTQGIRDFDIADETYLGYDILPTVRPLLTTNEPSSTPTVAWAHNYGKSRVVYIQMGHNHPAYINSNYRRLLAQAIRWTARR